jgi:hypothetical protein
MDDKKIFDVTPPKTAESVEAAKSARKILLNTEPTLKQETSASPDIVDAVSEPEPEKKAVVHQELILTPPTESSLTAPEIAENNDSVPAPKEVSEESPVAPDAVDVEKDEPVDALEKDEEPSAPTEEPEDDKQEPVKELAAFDSILPNDSQRATATAKDAMQSPTMFDTKAYYVPIGNSQHKHGHVVGSILAGILTAAIAVGAVLAAAKFL